MKKMFKKSKGFTLVELLIVVVIIGILAGMMMLSTGSATDKAEATKIVSDMRNMKAAAVMVYADTNVWPTAAGSLDLYLDQKIANNKYAYTIVSDNIMLTTAAAGTFVAVTDGVQDKLASLATTGVPIFKDTTKTAKYEKGSTGPYMPIK